MTTSPPLHIVVPARHEQDNLERLHAQVRTLTGMPARLIVVLDADDDVTLPVARRIAAADPGVRVVENAWGRGGRAAVLTGFDQVAAGPVLVAMADLSDDLALVPQMYRLYLDGAHVVCPSRWMRGGRQLGGPAVKRALSRAAGVTLSRLRGLPTHDATNNFRLYDKALLDRLDLAPEGGFELALEITVKAFLGGARIAELPTTWRARTAGRSKFRTWRWLPRYLRWYLWALVHRRRPAAAR
ncbi:MAG TPA: glycosyltransferase [Thermomonospora sp.]|nr:glycosyltransferase [Thermomonospora sp.]